MVNDQFLFIRHAESTANVADGTFEHDPWTDASLIDAELSPYGV